VKPEPNGTRTHEPSLRELTVDLDGLRDLLFEKIQSLKDIIDERDRLYKERDESRKTAVDAALAAAKEQNKQTFESSEKAIVKAEEGQRSYNTNHNDLAHKMDEQNKATMPRTETEARFHAMEEKISTLRDSVAAVGSSIGTQVAALTGVQAGGKSMKDESRANIAIIIAFLGLALTLAMTLYRFGAGK
jgi:predicted  nucleic acid-binding Zn-ribbon protein